MNYVLTVLHFSDKAALGPPWFIPDLPGFIVPEWPYLYWLGFSLMGAGNANHSTANCDRCSCEV